MLDFTEAASVSISFASKMTDSVFVRKLSVCSCSGKPKSLSLLHSFAISFSSSNDLGVYGLINDELFWMAFLILFILVWVRIDRHFLSLFAAERPLDFCLFCSICSSESGQYQAFFGVVSELDVYVPQQV